MQIHVYAKILPSQEKQFSLHLSGKVPLFAHVLLQPLGYPHHILQPTGHTVGRKHPTSSHKLPGVGPSGWTYALLAGCRLLSIQQEGCSVWPKQESRCQQGDFCQCQLLTWCLWSKVCPLLLQIFILLFFKCFFFVSRTSLKFPDYCLLWVMVMFLFSISDSGHLLSRWFLYLIIFMILIHIFILTGELLQVIWQGWAMSTPKESWCELYNCKSSR